MKKILLALVSVISLCSFVSAREPSTTAWVPNVTITALFEGDYNVTNGYAFIQGSDGDMYVWSTNTTYGRLMYETALAAKLMGKRVNILKNTVPNAETTNYFFVYRVTITD